MEPLRLELIRRHCIADPGLGLNEPSGLSLNADGTALVASAGSGNSAVNPKANPPAPNQAAVP